MSDNNLSVADNVVVSLDYVLTIDENHEIERSEKDAPLEYLHGFNNIIPGLENELNGMKIGDEKDVIVEPSQGYGNLDPEGITEYLRNSFPKELKLVVGEPIMMRDSESGDRFQAFVKEIRSDVVLLDFNHPLAGETLHFHVRIAGLREPTSEELAHGHVHQPGHGH
jgi:FKBP-type peptidyl-prolyl cis-trans isomerase SlyD